MGTCDHTSELVRRIAYPSAERPGARKDSHPAAFPNEGREQPNFSKPEGRKEDDLIFHGLIASRGTLTPRNPWATFGSLIFQLLLVLALALIPLFHVAPIPRREKATILYLEAPRVAGAKVLKIKAPTPTRTFTHTPTRTAIPAPVPTTQEAPPAPVDTSSEMATGASSGFPDGTQMRDGSPNMPLPVKTEPTPVKRIRVASRVAEANLIHDVPPQYPPEAGRERIEGTVVLLAVIGTDGTVKDVQVESGPPLLAQAAIEAVKQWRYKPYLLNGVPVELDSRITVNFTMSRG
jgi:periplasmic protein TonB